MDALYTRLFEAYRMLEQQQNIDFNKPEKQNINKLPSMVTIMFEDMSMNRTSPVKFSTDLSKWRKLQSQMGFGDYGGVFDASSILSAIENVESQVQNKQLSDIGDLSAVYSSVTGVDNAMTILSALKKIAQMAQKANVKVAAITSNQV